jgi:hypothetical protein
MVETFITPAQGAKLKELRAAYFEWTRRAADAIAEGGMSSEAFMKAEAETALIERQIREILGTTGKHWMA